MEFPDFKIREFNNYGCKNMPNPRYSEGTICVYDALMCKDNACRCKCDNDKLKCSKGYTCGVESKDGIRECRTKCASDSDC